MFITIILYYLTVKIDIVTDFHVLYEIFFMATSDHLTKVIFNLFHISYPMRTKEYLKNYTVSFVSDET